MKKLRKKLLNQLRQDRDKFAAEKNWPSMLWILNRMLEIDPSSKRFCARADLLRRLGCFDEAKESYQDALILNPNYDKVHKGLERLKEKIEYLENQIPSKMLDTYQQLASTNIKKIRLQITSSIFDKDWETAAKFCKKWTTLEVTPLRFCMEAAMLLQSQKWQEAIICYDKALQEDANFPIANRGIEKIKETLKKQEKYKQEAINLESKSEKKHEFKIPDLKLEPEDQSQPELKVLDLGPESENKSQEKKREFKIPDLKLEPEDQSQPELKVLDLEPESQDQSQEKKREFKIPDLKPEPEDQSQPELKVLDLEPESQDQSQEKKQKILNPEPESEQKDQLKQDSDDSMYLGIVDKEKS
ncbi:tetratricopeptide repeat protein [Candidatus Uabimicrobium sp. HlEnr_7]|uniref:tetratricopeptide repeat protein n=1 Tax=Candidatus Uabimicrobium helgolandensis TaxID=3095367 RepID=UPI003556C4AA